MGLSLTSGPATLAFIGSPVAAMPQQFVLTTNRKTASAQASTAVSDNGSSFCRYAYTSHPYKAGDVITGSAFSNAGLNVRQTVTAIAANTFDTNLAWAAGYTGLTGTVTRTNDNLQIAATLKVGGVGVITGRLPVSSAGVATFRVDRALLLEMEAVAPPTDDDTELDTETFLTYSLYAIEEFDDQDGVLKTADDYTSGSYYCAYGYRPYQELRTATAYMLTLGSYRSLMTRRGASPTVVMPRGARLWLTALIEGGVGINDVRVESVQRAGSTETTEAGDQVSTADAYCKVVGCYGPDIYTADVDSATVYLKANGTTRISENISVVFTNHSRYLTFYWLNHLGGWDAVYLTHYKMVSQNTTSRQVAWSPETATYTIGEAQGKVYDVQSLDGFNLRGQVPTDGSARAFAGILESEQVYMIDTDGKTWPVLVDGEGIQYGSDEITYFDINVTYAVRQI